MTGSPKNQHFTIPLLLLSSSLNARISLVALLEEHKHVSSTDRETCAHEMRSEQTDLDVFSQTRSAVQLYRSSSSSAAAASNPPGAPPAAGRPPPTPPSGNLNVDPNPRDCCKV
mmetsp:Transcript_22339/g.61268  ORF Transcript_22339/g.61268 Transcript_22339/m.61268 type:complete len:114 (+) Transcript_22339:77-418(+)